MPTTAFPSTPHRNGFAATDPASINITSCAETGYSYSYGLMGLSKSMYQLPLLVLPHLRPLGTSVGGKLLGTAGASCIVTAVLRPCGGCICATTSLRICDLAQLYPPHPCYLSFSNCNYVGPRSMGWHVCWASAAASLASTSPVAAAASAAAATSSSSSSSAAAATSL